jgi:DNA-binding transcriptional regulator PaaX
MASASPDIPSWTFLTNHGHVMVCIAQQPDIRLAEFAQIVGIGERAVHRIVHELIEAGYLTSTKVGRRNTYQMDLERPLRHPLESSHRLGAILDPLSSPQGSL